MMNRWNENKTLEFVKAYKEHPCLWNMKSNVYKNKQAREKAYGKLTEVVGDSSFTILDVKNKIKNLRSTYYQELKKIKLSKISGSGKDDVYIPNIIWFEEMNSFLGNASDLKDTQSDMNAEKALLEPSTENNETHQNVTSDSNSVIEYSLDNIGNINLWDSTTQNAQHKFQPSVKKRRVDSIGKVATTIHQHRGTPVTNVEDEFYYFGMNVASQLRQLPLEMALGMQVQIQSLLLEERISAIREQS